MISQEKWEALKEEMKKLAIFEKDLKEEFILGSGSGGQKINRTHSCVYLKHLPTQLEVKCQKTRMRDDNRFFARRLLLEKFTKEVLGEKTKGEVEKEKKAKQKKRRARRSQSSAG